MVRRRAKVAWSRLANLDLDSAHGYLLEVSPVAARRFAGEILAAVDRLGRQPRLGAVARDLLPEGRYRHLVCGSHRIIYRIDEDTVIILRVWDARQDPHTLRPEPMD